jgi:rubrerythrin
MKSQTLAPKPSGGALGARYFDKLVATPRGRAFVLRFLQSTEESDEGAVFDMLLSQVNDPEFHKLVRIHRDDEERHAGIFRRAVERLVERFGPEVEPGPVPEELHVVGRLDAHLGGLSESFIAGRAGIMEVYALLLVVEERAVREWPVIVDALRAVDPEAAEDVARVINDERRHVKYARAISRRYAPDAETLERTLAWVRAAEQRAFEENNAAMTRIVLERDLLDVGSIERAFWKGLVYLDSLRLERTVPAPFVREARAA